MTILLAVMGTFLMAWVIFCAIQDVYKRQLLKQQGFVSIDRRRGAIVAIDVDKLKAMEELKENLVVALAKGFCKKVSRSEVHQLIDEIFDEYDL